LTPVMPFLRTKLAQTSETRAGDRSPSEHTTTRAARRSPMPDQAKQLSLWSRMNTTKETQPASPGYGVLPPGSSTSQSSRMSARQKVSSPEWQAKPAGNVLTPQARTYPHLAGVGGSEHLATDSPCLVCALESRCDKAPPPCPVRLLARFRLRLDSLTAIWSTRPGRRLNRSSPLPAVAVLSTVATSASRRSA